MAFIYYSLLLLVIGIIGLACAETKGVPIGTAVGTSWVSKTSNSDSQGKADAVYTVYGKYLTGTLYGSGYNTQVAHEIDINKVVSYSVLVRSNNVFYPPNYTYTTGYNFQSLLNSIYVQINPTPNYAQYIYGQTFLIYIQYIG